jgi:5-methylcytosine-specific restriction protein B
MKIVLEKILWRRVDGSDSATIKSLIGESRGQYDIRLTSYDFIGFFLNLSKEDETQLGGFDIRVPICAIDCEPRINETEIVVRFMGPDSSRKDWYIRSQRPESAYFAWREGHGFEARDDVGNSDYLIILKDIAGGFHARWIRTSELNLLPQRVREIIAQRDVGWSEL